MIRWIFTFVLLPFFSFSLTRGCNLFSSNFSSISIALHRRGEFFLWCLLCGGFFYSQLSDEPYYPVNDAKNGALYEKYKELAEKEDKVIFGGRLGEYKYYDMDAVIASALELVKKEL